jgi:long-chain acyl-CoA synthetase
VAGGSVEKALDGIEAGTSAGDGRDTLHAAFKHVSNTKPGKRCLGWRPRKGGKPSGPYQWMSYKECRGLSLDAGAALCKAIDEHSASSTPSADHLRTVGIFSKNCPEWTLACLACDAYGLTSLPL